MKVVIPAKALLWDVASPYLEILISFPSDLVLSLGYPISKTGRFFLGLLLLQRFNETVLCSFGEHCLKGGEPRTGRWGRLQVHLPSLLNGGLVTQLPTGSGSS